MKKRFIALAGASVLTLSLAITAFAAQPVRYGNGYGNGFCGGGYRLMCDDNGSFLDKDAFEARLDEFIEDGLIEEDDKAYFLERYDYCVTNGGGYMGGRGGCGMYYTQSN